MDQRFYDAIEASPVIAAIKNLEGLEKCLQLEDIKVVFILFGDICNISEIIEKAKKANKIIMVHIDLIPGLESKEISVDYIKKYTLADGIISTKPSMIKRGKELSLFTILRMFVLDSMTLDNIKKNQISAEPDFIEILPGTMPKTIKKICKEIHTPIIAGGLISDKEDVVMALSAGAISVSTTSYDVWLM